MTNGPPSATNGAKWAFLFMARASQIDGGELLMQVSAWAWALACWVVGLLCQLAQWNRRGPGRSTLAGLTNLREQPLQKEDRTRKENEDSDCP